MHIAVSQRARALLIVVLVAIGLIAANAPANAAPPGSGRRTGRQRRAAPTSRSATRCPSATAAGFAAVTRTRATSSAIPNWWPRTSIFGCSTPAARARRRPASSTPGAEQRLRELSAPRSATGTSIPCTSRYLGLAARLRARVLEKAPHVRLVTLQLGANDAFLCQRSGGCVTPQAIAALAAQVGANLNTILGDLRSEGDYRGRIVVVTYYALDYADPVGVAGTQILDQAITAAARANRAVVADGFAAFRAPPWRREAVRSPPAWSSRTTSTRRRRASDCSPRRSSRPSATDTAVRPRAPRPPLATSTLDGESTPTGSV